MANPAPVIRNEVQEAQRQISYTETMKQRATEKYLAKIRAYDAKIELLREVTDTASAN